MRLSKARKACVTAMMKDTIFEAANSVLNQHGIGGLTMDRVATEVGVATGSLYNYFQDKDELLRFFFTRLVEPCFAAMEEVANSDLPTLKKLEAILRTALDQSVKNKGLIRLLAGIEHDAEIRKNARPRFLKLLTAIFQRGIEDGSFHPHDPSHFGRMFLGCTSELFELQASGASDAEVERYTQALIDVGVHGFSIHTAKGLESGRTGTARSDG